MLKTKIIKTSNYFIKSLIIILSFGFIAYRLFYKQNISELYNGFISLTSDPSTLSIIIIVFILMLINWSIESIKWRYLIKKIEKVSFIKSFMAVWAGLTVGSFTPNRTGEYFGRAFILDKANRWEGIFITFTGSLSQLLITLLFGTIAGFCFIASFQSDLIQFNHVLYYTLLGISVIVTALIFILYFRISWLKRFFQKIIPRKYSQFSSHFDVYSYYSIKELVNVLGLSLIRYVVFTAQFYILLRLCHIEIPFFDGLMLISFIFLVMTAIPTFALTELGVRGTVSIFLLEMYFENITLYTNDISSNAILASFLIWFINLVIPAIIGGFFVFKLKFFRK